MGTTRTTAERIREQARALGFDDWSTGDLGELEADIRASSILKLSKDLRDAAQQGDHAAVVTYARAIVAFIDTDRCCSSLGPPQPTPPHPPPNKATHDRRGVQYS
jgi:hypothetical protein